MTPNVAALEAGLVRIRDRDRICGTGFLTGVDLVCTCAHVVTDALGLPPGAVVGHETPVQLDFPFLPGGLSAATVVSFSSESAQDVAVLRLTSPAPAGARAVKMMSSDGVEGREFTVWGFPRGNDHGALARGRVSRTRADGTVQLEGNQLAGYAVQPGFSGAPVWDPRGHGVIGMMVAAETDQSLRVSIMVSANTIARVAPLVPVKRLVGLASLGEGMAGLPNTPLTSLENFVHEYYGDDRRRSPFGGRDTSLRELDDWLDDPGSALGLLVAEAGRGKSSLLIHWLDDLLDREAADIAFVPVSLRFNTSTRVTSLSMLGARLRHLGLVSGDLASDAGAWASEIDTLLRQDQAPDRTLLVVIDGADEATDWTIGRHLQFPVRLGRGVKILVSARAVAGRDPAAWARTLGWDDPRIFVLPPLSTTAITEVLRSMGEPLATAARPELAAEIARMSEGDPLLVGLWAELLFDATHNGHPLDAIDLVSVGSGLGDFFQSWWDQQEQLWQADGVDLRGPRHQQMLSFFFLCASALGPFTRAEMGVLGEGVWRSTDISSITNDARRFVTGDGVKQGWVFSHPRLAQYFRERVMLDPDVEDWEERLLGLGRRTAEQLRAGHPLRPDLTYGLRLYGAHLERAHQRRTELDPRHAQGPCECGRQLAELVDPHWQHAREQLDGSLDEFRNDVARAWSHLLQALELTAGHTSEAAGPPVLSQMIRCALVEASISHLAAALPANLVVALVKHEVWTAAQALSHIRNLGDSEKAAALGGLMPLAPAFEHEMVELARSVFSPTDRVRALVLIARGAPPDLATALVAEAGETILADDQEFSAHLLKECPELVTAMWAASAEVSDPVARLSTRLVVCEHLPAERRHEELEALQSELAALPLHQQLLLPAELALTNQTVRRDELSAALVARSMLTADPEQRAQDLAQLVPLLEEPSRSEALSAIIAAAASTTNEISQIYLVIGVANLLPPPLIPPAVEVIRSVGAHIDNDYAAGSSAQQRASALADLAHKITIDGTGLAREALETAVAIQDDYWREVALAHLATLALPTMTADLVEATEFLPSTTSRLRVLAALSGYRNEVGAETLARQVLAEPMDQAAAAALETLAPVLDAETLKTIIEATAADDSHEARQSGMALLERIIDLPSTEQDEMLLTRAVDVLFRLSPTMRSLLVASLVPLLGADLLRQVLTRNRLIDDPLDRVGAGVALLIGLPDHHRAEAVQKFLALLENANPTYERSQLMTRLAPWLDRQQRRSMLGWPTADVIVRAGSVRALAEHGAWDEAWELARSTDAREWLDALAALGGAALAKGAADQLRTAWQEMLVASAAMPPARRARLLLPLSAEQPPQVKAGLFASLSDPTGATGSPYSPWQRAFMVEHLAETDRQLAFEALADEALATPSFLAGDGLYALAELLRYDQGGRVASRAIDSLAQKQSSLSRLVALRQLAPGLPASVHDRALDLALDEVDEQTRSSGLAALAPVLDEGPLRRALQSCEKFVNAYWQHRAECHLLADLARVGHPEEAFKRFAASDRRYGQGEALGRMAAFLPEELLPPAIELAGTTSDYDRSQALTGLLLRQAELGHLELAFGSAHQISLDEDRARLIAQLMPDLLDLAAGDILPLWTQLLAHSAQQSRAALLSDLRASAPLIVSLGSPSTIAALVDDLVDIGVWFP